MLALVDVEAELALFTEGIAGRYYHIKSTSEFSGRRVELPPDEAAVALDTVYVPDTMDSSNPAAYRVVVMLQLGLREFGTFNFNLETARVRIPALTALEVPSHRVRESDFTLFFHHVALPGLLRRLFSCCERVRVVAGLLARYPGLQRHLADFREEQHAGFQPQAVNDLAALMDAFDLATDGLPESLLIDTTDLLEPSLALLDNLRKPQADVYDSAGIAYELYETWTGELGYPSAEALTEELEVTEDGLEWMQREARLEDWEESLKKMEDNLQMQLQMPEGAEVDAIAADDLEDASIREEQIDIRSLSDDRDNLKRRLDMERSAIRDALGPVKPMARSYRYDEWDYHHHKYLRHWCRLFEERLVSDEPQDPKELSRVIQQHAAAVMRQLEQIKPLGYQRIRRVTDGDELDFNALIDTRQDVRAGISPDERVYSRRDRVHRDVCAAFLVDLSASTDDPIEPAAAPPVPPGAEVQEINLRDPFDDDVLALAHEVGSESPPRRIIDVQRESMLVMSAALERLGDSYGIYGFSGYGRDCVEFYVAKEPGEPFTHQTLEAIASMKPRRSTRMGPAIRHSTAKLLASGNAMKLLMILSDGFPQDSDYGPERGDHEYGLQDTAKALKEAQTKGVEVFCVTVDKSGNDYLKRMCPPSRYLIIDEIEDLPEKLSKVYQVLTGK
jgi:nitric oxide reductase NorD protein